MEIQGLMQYQHTINIGYPMTPSFFSQKSAILEKLLQRYPRYSLQDETIVVFTEEPGFQIVITPQNITLIQNRKINNLDSISELRNVWLTVNRKLKISKINNMNIASDYIKKMSMADAYTISNKFVNQSIFNLLGVTTEQSQVVINYDENKRKNVLKILPGTVQNITINIGPNQNIAQQTTQESMQGLIVSINSTSNDVLPFRFDTEIAEMLQSINTKIDIIEKGGF